MTRPLVTMIDGREHVAAGGVLWRCTCIGIRDGQVRDLHLHSSAAARALSLFMFPGGTTRREEWPSMLYWLDGAEY